MLKQITPYKILSNHHHLEEYLKGEFTQLATENCWMTNWEHLVQRFQLLKFNELSEEGILKLAWNEDQIQELVTETFNNVSQYLHFNEMRITVVPALPKLYHFFFH